MREYGIALAEMPFPLLCIRPIVAFGRVDTDSRDEAGQGQCQSNRPSRHGFDDGGEKLVGGSRDSSDRLGLGEVKFYKLHFTPLSLSLPPAMTHHRTHAGRAERPGGD